MDKEKKRKLSGYQRVQKDVLHFFNGCYFWLDVFSRPTGLLGAPL